MCNDAEVFWCHKHLKSKKKTLAEQNPKCLPSLFLISLLVIVDDDDVLTKSLSNSK
jgi:hypothetical protein